jgi:spore coat-associated protein N
MHERLLIIAGKRRALLLLAAVALLLAAVVSGSGAIFTSTSANPNNIFTAGNLHQTNSKDGSAILTATRMKPLDVATGTVTIANDGDLAGTFSLSSTVATDTAGPNGGRLSTVLDLVIYDQTTNTQVYSGKINAMPPTTALGTWAVAEARTYLFTVTFPDGGTPGSNTTGDNAYKSALLNMRFDWTAVQ